MQKIAVQRGLTPVQEYLSERGYEVEVVDFDAFSKARDEEYDAIVLTGMSKNFLGMEDTATNAPVIDATGMTPEEVCEQIEQAFL
ncbi:MAG: YkuS family protein [Clostridiaceae bacterium]|jgi:DNA-binding response OmpR family regulator|nr:YkuS family protein [Clostridiaceae bacterium]